MSEEKIAKDIGARLIKNSGRGREKGDMEKRIGELQFIIDAKEGKTFTLSEEVWSKACHDALTHDIEAMPMILRVFPDGVKIAMIAWDDFEMILKDEYYD